MFLFLRLYSFVHTAHVLRRYYGVITALLRLHGLWRRGGLYGLTGLPAYGLGQRGPPENGFGVFLTRHLAGRRIELSLVPFILMCEGNPQAVKS